MQNDEDGHNFVRTFNGIENIKLLSWGFFVVRKNHRYRVYSCEKCKIIAFKYGHGNYITYISYNEFLKISITCDEVIIKRLLE